MLKIIDANCHEEVELHVHVQTSGWAHHPRLEKLIQVVRVDVHNPETGLLEGVSVVIEAP